MPPKKLPPARLNLTKRMKGKPRPWHLHVISWWIFNPNPDRLDFLYLSSWTREVQLAVLDLVGGAPGGGDK